jgi:hypothetical protein
LELVSAFGTEAFAFEPALLKADGDEGVELAVLRRQGQKELGGLFKGFEASVKTSKAFFFGFHFFVFGLERVGLGRHDKELVVAKDMSGAGEQLAVAFDFDGLADKVSASEDFDDEEVFHSC